MPAKGELLRQAQHVAVDDLANGETDNDPPHEQQQKREAAHQRRAGDRQPNADHDDQLVQIHEVQQQQDDQPNHQHDDHGRNRQHERDQAPAHRGHSSPPDVLGRPPDQFRRESQRDHADHHQRNHIAHGGPQVIHQNLGGIVRFGHLGNVHLRAGLFEAGLALDRSQWNQARRTRAVRQIPFDARLRPHAQAGIAEGEVIHRQVRHVRAAPGIAHLCIDAPLDRAVDDQRLAAKIDIAANRAIDARLVAVHQQIAGQKRALMNFSVDADRHHIRPVLGECRRVEHAQGDAAEMGIVAHHPGDRQAAGGHPDIAGDDRRLVDGDIRRHADQVAVDRPAHVHDAADEIEILDDVIALGHHAAIPAHPVRRLHSPHDTHQREEQQRAHQGQLAETGEGSSHQSFLRSAGGTRASGRAGVRGHGSHGAVTLPRYSLSETG